MITNTLSQHARLITIETAQGSDLPDSLVVESFTGNEGVNECFSFDIKTLSLSTTVDLKQFIGEEITLRLLQADGSYRAWHGYCTEASWLGADGGIVRYHLRLESFLAFLNLRHNAIIFQDKNVQQIMTDILADYPQANFAWEATQPLITRAITTQYRESDLTFISRILAAEGLSFRFEHEQDDVLAPDNADLPHARHKLVIFDSQTAKPDTFVDALSGRIIRYHGVRATESSDSIQQFSAKRQVQSNAVTVASWNPFELHATSSERTSGRDNGELPDLPIYQVASERWFNESTHAEQRAELNQYALGLHNKVFSGAGAVRGMQAGHAFSLSQHDGYPEGDNRFIVMSVQHAATNNFAHGVDSYADTIIDTAMSLLATTDSEPSDPDDPPNVTQLERGIYRNRFNCLRDSVPVVPMQTALRQRPTAMGPQSAIVVGLPGATITTERDHRIKIQFSWQRGHSPISGGMNDTGTLGGNASYDDTSGTWVRVAESVAGPNWGSHFTPRIGSEVLVDFIEGDMDKPIVVGVMYNGDDLPPYSAGIDSGVNHAGTISGVHSKSLEGSGYNEWLVDDASSQLRTRMASSTASSQLNMGYLIQQSPFSAERGQYRGEGVELRTDAWGVLRGQEGILLSTSTRKASGTSVESTQMDSAESVSQLHGAKALSDALSQSAAQQSALHSTAANDAQTINIKAIDAKQDGKYTGNINGQVAKKAQLGSRILNDAVERFASPILHIDSASTTNLASPASTLIYAGKHMHWTTQADTHWTAGHTLASVSGKTSSLYTHSGGIQAFAGNGPVSVQAHTDALEILADQEVIVTSSQANISINAANKITLTAGQSSITLDGANITFACPGTFTVKSGMHAFKGGGRAKANLAPLPTSKVKAAPLVEPNTTPTLVKQYDEQFVVYDPVGNPLADIPYEIEAENFKQTATTKMDGTTTRVQTQGADKLTYRHKWKTLKRGKAAKS